MGAGWAKPTPSLWAEPKKSFQPFVWSYAQAKGALDAAGRLINTELAERRNLIMQNPAGGSYATSRTIVAAYQMIMPGEKARSHRHTPNALRLIIDAEPGAYTIVNGERLSMMPGDVVLTPNWCWHGHGNDSRACAYWLDVLDVPLVQLLEPMFFEPHPDEFEKETVVANASPMHFSWADTQRRLAEAGSALERAAGRDRARRSARKSALDTMALSMIELKAGQATAPRKVMANSVFGVAKGSGTTEVDGKTLSWSRGDVIVVPAWHEHVHRSDDGAVLFRVTDEPVMREARLPARRASLRTERVDAAGVWRVLRLLSGAAAAAQECRASRPPASRTAAAGAVGDAQTSICLLAGVRGAGQRPAGRILRPRDLAGKPLPRRCGRADDPQRPARAGHRAIHAGHGGGAKSAQPARPDPGVAEIGGIPARPARRIRQSRACRRGLQRRAPARARVAGGHRPDAGGNPRLCARPSPAVPVEQWSKAGADADRKQEQGPACGTLMALLKRAPKRFRRGA